MIFELPLRMSNESQPRNQLNPQGKTELRWTWHPSQPDIPCTTVVWRASEHLASYVVKYPSENWPVHQHHNPILVRRTALNITPPCQTSLFHFNTWWPSALRSADEDKQWKWLNFTKHWLQVKLRNEDYEFGKIGRTKLSCQSGMFG